VAKQVKEVKTLRAEKLKVGANLRREDQQES
jgi:hypothetical protein